MNIEVRVATHSISRQCTDSAKWELRPLGEVADILDSKRIPVNSKERESRVGNVPYYGATGQVGWIDDYLFDEELVLLGEDGAPFLDPSKPKAYLVRGKSWVNNHAHVLRGRTVPNAWLAYYLNSIHYDGFVSGTTRLKLTQAAMRQIMVPVTSLPTMQSIVAEIEKQFSRLDEAVAGLKRVKANLKRYKAAVLKAAVEGRLVETEAEIARRECRSYETGEQLLQRIIETRRSQWKGKGKYKEPAAPDTTDLPELPEGWGWASVEQLACLVEYGSSAKTNEDSGVPVLRMGNIVEGELQLDELKYLPSSHGEFPKLLLKSGDLLFNRTNSPELVGKTAVYDGLPKECSFASYLIRVRLADGAAPKFLAIYINSSHGRNWIKSVVTQQVGQANVNGTKLQALSVPLPPQAEQNRIVAEVDRHFSLICEAENQVDANLKRAERMRQSILQTVFSGN
jgi:type I restriction enzyme S subunit